MFPENQFAQHDGTNWQKKVWKKPKANSMTMRDAILAVVRNRRHGAVCDDIKAATTEFPWESVRSRIQRMAERGELVKTGEKRKGANGVHQLVYKVPSQ